MSKLSSINLTSFYIFNKIIKKFILKIFYNIFFLILKTYEIYLAEYKEVFSIVYFLGLQIHMLSNLFIKYVFFILFKTTPLN